MKIKTLLTTLLLICSITINAAPFKNVKKILTQPDGTKLHCYASGDEFYNRLHDIDGFTIVQNEDGYFVYATMSRDGEMIASQYVAGKSNPKDLGLTPNISISKKEYHKKRELMKTPELRNHGLNHGVYNNLVVFIRFKGDADFGTTQTQIDSMFNYNGYYDISMNNYFKKMTYNKLSMVSHVFPKSDDDKILSYEDVYPRRYYTPYNEKTNPEGYKEDERGQREFALLKRAIESIADQVPDTLDIDRDNDGHVDNVIFVVKGNVGDWSDLLWPHMWSLHGEDVFIHDKRVMTFNFQLETSTYFNVSTLCHEMAHSLGLPDLYHYEEWYSDFSPVGSWDLMCANADPPQHTATYMKYKYGTWIDEIPEIEYGTYTIEANSWEGGRRNCFKIPSEDPDQYYLVEYRNDDNFFERKIPNGGLLIYRIDPRFYGCADYNGHDIFDELYIYRPGGSANTNGNLNSAAFCKERNTTEFNHTTNPYPFLNFGGTDKNVNICNISATGDQMTFSYLPINSELIPVDFTVNVKKDEFVELAWDTVDYADSYNVYRDGILLAANVKNTFYNDSYENISKGYHAYYVSSNCQNEESFHSAEESVIIGDYCEYAFDMNSDGENGWQGGEIKLSFDNGMKDIYLTLYSGKQKTRNIIVPTEIEMSVSWIQGWDDSECSFSISCDDEVVYSSSDLKEGLLTKIKTEGYRTCVQPKNLTAELSDNFVYLNWNSIVESDSYTVLRNDEVLAENVKANSFVDRTLKKSGTYAYSVMSQKENCVSEPSEKVTVTMIKYDNDIDGDAYQSGNNVNLSWSVNITNSSSLNYDNGEYVTSIGANSNTWGIRIPVDELKKFKDAKITAIEIFDASSAKYTFNIHSGETPHDKNRIYTEVFNTTESNEFKTFQLSEEISFDISQDLWVTAKSASSSNKPIPCCNFVGTPNSNMIKVGSTFKSASEYDMDYSWLLRIHVKMSENLLGDLTYNIYRQDSLLASDLKSTTYIDNNIIGGDVCYNIEAVYDNEPILYSDNICLTVGVDEMQCENDSAEIFPNPTRDFISVTGKDLKNIKIMSINGGVVFEQNMNHDVFEIDMREFGCGVYLMQITTESETWIEKVAVY